MFVGALVIAALGDFGVAGFFAQKGTRRGDIRYLCDTRLSILSFTDESSVWDCVLRSNTMCRIAEYPQAKTNIIILILVIIIIIIKARLRQAFVFAVAQRVRGRKSPLAHVFVSELMNHAGS